MYINQHSKLVMDSNIKSETVIHRPQSGESTRELLSTRYHEFAVASTSLAISTSHSVKQIITPIDNPPTSCGKATDTRRLAFE